MKKTGEDVYHAYTTVILPDPTRDIPNTGRVGALAVKDTWYRSPSDFFKGFDEFRQLLDNLSFSSIDKNGQYSVNPDNYAHFFEGTLDAPTA